MTSADNSATAIQVRRPTAAEADESETVLATAFMHNPTSQLMFGMNPDPRRLVRFNRWMIASKHVSTLVAVCGGDIVGVLKYADYPECEPTGWHAVKFLLDSLLAWRWRSLFLVPLMLWGGYHLKTDHRHLIVIGVRPDMHRKGIGSALLTHFNRHADHDQINGFLATDTENARKLYERHAYKTCKHEIVCRKYNIWHMSRTHPTTEVPPPRPDEN